MCRIAGILHTGFPVGILEEKVRLMCDLLKHGGPDDEGIYTSAANNIVLGNRRLALIDLSPDGHMPMQYQQRYFITYNGELYNFPVLKEELISLGHSFKNHTDTEVILAAFAQWNVQSFSKLKGMFAFALWDSWKKELFLVRDPSGIKPLYYASKGDMLVFASEVRAFAPIESLQVADPNWPVFLMAYGYVPEPLTTLKDVKTLQKGSFLKYSLPDQQVSIQSFTHYSLTHQLHNKEEVMTSMKAILEDAVKRHLIADAPLGVFLSGGVDSGIIALLAEKHKKADLNTLSIYFEESEYSEKKYQDILKEKLQCQHNQHLLREDEFHTSFPAILDSMDLPSCDGINTWFICKYAASRGLKAVLSGIGGDELFGGYPSFKRTSAANLLQCMPNEILKMGKRTNVKRLNRMSYLSLGGVKGIYLFLRGHYSPVEIAKRLGCTEKEIWTILEEHPLFMDISELQTKNQASWMEFNLYMQNQLLRDSDVMSMIHGVEIRVPLLDDELIRLAFKTDPAIKFEGPLAKQALINSYKDLLPEQIWNRPKMGFSFPFAKWLKSSDYVKDLMESGNLNAVDKYKKFTKGKLHWSHMMSLIILNKRNV